MISISYTGAAGSEIAVTLRGFEGAQTIEEIRYTNATADSELSIGVSEANGDGLVSVGQIWAEDQIFGTLSVDGDVESITGGYLVSGESISIAWDLGQTVLQSDMDGTLHVIGSMYGGFSLVGSDVNGDLTVDTDIWGEDWYISGSLNAVLYTTNLYTTITIAQDVTDIGTIDIAADIAEAGAIAIGGSMNGVIDVGWNMDGLLTANYFNGDILIGQDLNGTISGTQIVDYVSIGRDLNGTVETKPTWMPSRYIYEVEVGRDMTGTISTKMLGYDAWPYSTRDVHIGGDLSGTIDVLTIRGNLTVDGVVRAGARILAQTGQSTPMEFTAAAFERGSEITAGGSFYHIIATEGDMGADISATSVRRVEAAGDLTGRITTTQYDVYELEVGGDIADGVVISAARYIGNTHVGGSIASTARLTAQFFSGGMHVDGDMLGTIEANMGVVNGRISGVWIAGALNGVMRGYELTNINAASLNGQLEATDLIGSLYMNGDMGPQAAVTAGGALWNMNVAGNLCGTVQAGSLGAEGVGYIGIDVMGQILGHITAGVTDWIAAVWRESYDNPMYPEDAKTVTLAGTTGTLVIDGSVRSYDDHALVSLMTTSRGTVLESSNVDWGTLELIGLAYLQVDGSVDRLLTMGIGPDDVAHIAGNLNSAEILGHMAGSLSIEGDVTLTIQVAGDLSGTVETTGAFGDTNGNIGAIWIDGNVSGEVNASGSIGEIQVWGPEISGAITSQASIGEIYAENAVVSGTIHAGGNVAGVNMGGLSGIVGACGDLAGPVRIGGDMLHGARLSANRFLGQISFGGEMLGLMRTQEVVGNIEVVGSFAGLILSASEANPGGIMLDEWAPGGTIVEDPTVPGHWAYFWVNADWPGVDVPLIAEEWGDPPVYADMNEYPTDHEYVPPDFQIEDKVNAIDNVAQFLQFAQEYQRLFQQYADGTKTWDPEGDGDRDQFSHDIRAQAYSNIGWTPPWGADAVIGSYRPFGPMGEAAVLINEDVVNYYTAEEAPYVLEGIADHEKQHMDYEGPRETPVDWATEEAMCMERTVDTLTGALDRIVEDC